MTDDDPDAYTDTELARYFMVAAVEAGVGDGSIVLADRSDGEIEEAVRAYISVPATNRDVPMDWITDYQPDLLEEAVRYREAGAHCFAVVFFAMWAEHWLNGMIFWAAARGSLERVEADRRVHETMYKKTGRVWRELFGDDLPAGLQGRILDLANERNNFVHYKWTPVAGDIADQAESSYETASHAAESIVEELRQLENDIVFAGRRDVVARVVENMIKHLDPPDFGSIPT